MIKTTEHCDACQVEISPDVTRPGFPQISWCYFKKGLQIVMGQTGEPILQKNWLGQVNRMEFCQEHGDQLNVLLKAFHVRDAMLLEILQNLSDSDDLDWRLKQTEIAAKFNLAHADYEKKKAGVQK